MDSVMVATLQDELDKARKREKQQREILDNNRRIINTPGMESIKSVARRRLPKLTEVYEETLKVIAELEQALHVGKQPDLLEVSSSPPSPSPSDPPASRKR